MDCHVKGASKAQAKADHEQVCNKGDKSIFSNIFAAKKSNKAVKAEKNAAKDGAVKTDEKQIQPDSKPVQPDSKPLQSDNQVDWLIQQALFLI